jgi:hypothetical protein
MKESELIVFQVLSAWRKENKTISDIFSKHDDAFYDSEIAPGRNRAIYLLGHLLTVNDGLFPLFGLGSRLFPAYESLFLRSPDRSTEEIPSIAELKQNWEIVNRSLEQHFENMSVNDWLGRHQSVSPEDFEREPWRNKLNVIINRTVHQSYHIGQLALLEKKSD